MSVEKRRLGNSAIEVTPIIHGGWVAKTEGDAYWLARAALDRGISTFDTADVYGCGRGEVILGAALAKVSRDDVQIFTKVGAPTGPVPGRGLHPGRVFLSAEASLRRLQTDYIDVYYAHRFDVATPLEVVVEGFERLLKAGMVRAVGVSEWTSEQVNALATLVPEKMGTQYVCNQLQYSLLWRDLEATLMSTCARVGLSVVAWGPLLQGVLAGLANSDPGRITGRSGGSAGSLFERGATDLTVRKALARYQACVASYEISMASASLAWVLGRGVGGVVVGASSEAQLDENVRAVDVHLTEELLAAMDDILAPIAVTGGDSTPSHPGDYSLPDGGKLT